ncbi:hypothetical protein [Spiroplasma endosymbiont of Amphimallon solstitiale]|uniref:hypothetical protein n=1 Tax=Spiroplasma endosymbiont of Amphimallon solstitiale TaxID=3066288 RepID=UPI00313D1D1C
MKQFLILLSSITTLTISTSTFANLNQNTTFTNNLQTNNNNQNSLFNNQYGYLSTSDWITNQSTTNHKFYSYDTSALKNYTFANARNTFLVDITFNFVEK